MRILLATLALTVASAGSAVAGDSAIADRGIPQVLQESYMPSEYDPANVNAFRGVRGNPSDEGIPLVEQDRFMPSFFNYQPGEASNWWREGVYTPRDEGVPETVQ